MALRDLLERVERATGPDRELDRAIWKACGIDYRQSVTQPITESVDAALALIGRVLPGGWVGFQANRVTDPQRAWSAWLEVFPDKAKDYDTFERTAPTPALALCAALLAAMIEQETRDG